MTGSTRVALLRATAVVPLLFLTFASGCNRESADQKRVNNAKESAYRMLAHAGMTEAPGVFVTRHLGPGLSRGISLLDSPRWEEPAILVVQILLEPPGGRGYIIALDARFRARGVFIRNDRGYKGRFPVTQWTQEELEEFFKEPPVIMRQTFRIEFDDDDCGTGPSASSRKDTIPPLVIVPSDFLSGDVEVGLVLEDGSETEPVSAYIYSATRGPGQILERPPADAPPGREAVVSSNSSSPSRSRNLVSGDSPDPRMDEKKHAADRRKRETGSSFDGGMSK